METEEDDRYGPFNPSNPRHIDVLDNVKEYMDGFEERVSEIKLSWLLCSPQTYPLDKVQNHDEISQKDIVEDFRTEYSPKYLRNLFTGLRQYLEDQGFLKVVEEERGGNPKIIYKHTGDTE